MACHGTFNTNCTCNPPVYSYQLFFVKFLVQHNSLITTSQFGRCNFTNVINLRTIPFASLASPDGLNKMHLDDIEEPISKSEQRNGYAALSHGKTDFFSTKAAVGCSSFTENKPSCLICLESLPSLRLFSILCTIKVFIPPHIRSTVVIGLSRTGKNIFALEADLIFTANGT